jgi:hypothetical protein
MIGLQYMVELQHLSIPIEERHKHKFAKFLKSFLGLNMDQSDYQQLANDMFTLIVNKTTGSEPSFESIFTICSPSYLSKPEHHQPFAFAEPVDRSQIDDLAEFLKNKLRLKIDQSDYRQLADDMIMRLVNKTNGQSIDNPNIPHPLSDQNCTDQSGLASLRVDQSSGASPQRQTMPVGLRGKVLSRPPRLSREVMRDFLFGNPTFTSSNNRFSSRSNSFALEEFEGGYRRKDIGEILDFKRASPLQNVSQLLI